MRDLRLAEQKREQGRDQQAGDLGAEDEKRIAVAVGHLGDLSRGYNAISIPVPSAVSNS